MTEAEWWVCSDPIAMLESLQKVASERKLRCFISAWEQHSPRAAEVEGILRDQPWNHAWATVWEDADVSLEQELKCSLLRDIFGNPFRPPPSIDPSWELWNNGLVPKLARTASDMEAFDLLPILADALEDAG